MSATRAHRRLVRLQLPIFAALALGGSLFARIPDEGSGSGARSALARVVATPGDAGRENDLGNQLLLAGDLDGAEAAYRRAIAAAPEDATPHYNLGTLLLDRGHRFSASREFQRALELAPAHAEARFALGRTYDELGVDWLARRNYRQAFELDPTLADPRLHPDAARRRLALAALLEIWREEDAKGAEAEANAAPVPATGAELGEKPEATAPPAPKSGGEPRAPAGGGSGGYAHVTGGERTGRDEPGDRSQNVSEPPSESGASAAGPRRPHPPAKSPNDNVIDPTDLRTGVSVNQIVAPGESSRGGRGTGFPGKPTRGGGSRFVPPQRPIEPQFEPQFEPDEESTGRIEPLLLPADAERFAVAG